MRLRHRGPDYATLRRKSPLPIWAQISWRIGLVVGLLLLAIALWRGSALPRWVPAGLVAFLVVEFAGAGLTEWASVLASAIYLGVFGMLALTIWRTTDQEWVDASGAEPASTPGAPVAV